MKKISVEISAYILTLYPHSPHAAARSKGAKKGGKSTAAGVKGLQSLAMGLAVPSFWSRKEILDTFVEANRIWIREANIEFKPIRVGERSEVVPADETKMWAFFLRHLKPTGRGIGVGFVGELPGDEGGWGGSRVVLLSGEKAREGLKGNAGNLLAHELGHVLIKDPDHELAGDARHNLMYKSRNPRVANAGVLTSEQIRQARERAATI